MPKAKCVFCGEEQDDYKGIYYMKNDGTSNYYSSSKCMKNHLKLKRDKRKVRWTEAFHITRDKRVAKEKARREVEKEKDDKRMDEMKARAIEKAEKIIKKKISEKLQ